MSDTKDLQRLAERVEALKGYGNEIDVLCEIALFEPDDEYVAIRANAAGTKVIYTARDGREKTFIARDWTLGPRERSATAASLRARIGGADQSLNQIAQEN